MKVAERKQRTKPTLAMKLSAICMYINGHTLKDIAETFNVNDAGSLVRRGLIYIGRKYKLELDREISASKIPDKLKNRIYDLACDEYNKEKCRENIYNANVIAANKIDEKIKSMKAERLGFKKRFDNEYEEMLRLEREQIKLKKALLSMKNPISLPGKPLRPTPILIQ